MKQIKGVFYGVGTGPGDPELVTRKAWHNICSAKVIAFLAPEGGTSFARQIMADAIPKEAIEIPLYVPMVAGREPAQSIYEVGANQIKTFLDQGISVSMLCEGDPLTYGSFIYVLARLRQDYEVQIIAGVSSLQACAAAALHPLASRNEKLLILPAPLDDVALSQAILNHEAIALLKIGRHFARVKALIHKMGMLDNATYIAHGSLPNQLVCKLADAPEKAPYFSMILLYHGDEPWR